MPSGTAGSVQDGGWHLLFLAHIHGSTHSLVTLAMPVMRASRAEGAEPVTAALPAGAKPQPQAGLRPSAPAMATGGHPALGGWQTPLGPGLACREEEKL